MEKEVRVIAKPKKKKKKTKFWKGYKLFICLVLIIIVVVLAILFTSLYRYEKRITEQEAAAEEAENNSFDLFGNEAAAESTGGDEVIASIGQDTQERQIAVVCPSNYTLSINGEAVHGSEIFETADLPAKQYFESYIPEGESFPSMAAYAIDSVSSDAVIECRDAAGSIVEPVKEAYPFFQYDIACEEPSSDIKNYYSEFAAKYVKYCLNEGEQSTVTPYFLSGTSTYSDICKIEDVKQYSGQRSGYEIGDITFSNYQRYTDYAYRIQLNFTYTVTLNSTVRENPTVLDCYVANVNGQWKIVQMSLS